MNDSMDRRLADWLLEGPDHGPPAALERTLAATRRTSQRPGWSFPERWLPMQLTFQRGIAPRSAALLLVLGALIVVLAAAILVGSRPKVPAPLGPASNGLLVVSVDGTLLLIDPDGSAIRPLGGANPIPGSAPSVSLDGQRVAYWSRETSTGPLSLVVADLTGRPVLSVDSVTLPGAVRRVEPTPISPDSTRLAVALAEGATTRPWVVDIKSGNATEVPAAAGSVSDLAWSPDGSRIAYRRSDDGIASISVTDLDGTDHRDLVSLPDDTGRIFQGFVWSPDSSRIAYQYLGDGGGEVATVDLHGTVTTVAADSTSEFNPAFSPDGQTLAFLASDGQAVDLSAVDGTARRTLVRGVFAGNGCRIWWSPDGAWILGSPIGTDCGPTDSGALVMVDVNDPSTVIPVELPGRVSGLPTWQRITP